MSSALSVKNLSKSFGGSLALRGVSLSVDRGEIHGLLGQNGCGKSTLVKLLAGFHAPDSGGSAELFGEPVRLPLNTRTARRLGMSFVHQNLGLVAPLSVLENLRIAELTAANRLHINWAAERREAEAAFARMDVAIDPLARVSDLTPVERALVAITRAMEGMRRTQSKNASAGLLVLDEPTPFLPRADVDRLFALLRRIVKQGASVVLISHDIDEVIDITDRATVLRDGVTAGHFVTAQTSRDSIIEMIVGRRLTAFPSSVRKPVEHEQTTTIGNLTGPGLGPLNFSIGAGEIVGLTGLTGSGYEKVVYHLFGAIPATSGRLTLNQNEIDLPALAPAHAIANNIALLPGDRQGAGGFGNLPALDNLFVAQLRSMVRRGFLRRSLMQRRFDAVASRFDVRPPLAAKNLAEFSGGNAQKILLAKWLALNPRLLLLDEPTQGVDVGARQQLWQAIRAAAEAGAAVLCASSDHEQLARICDRVLIFGRGRLIADLHGAQLSKPSIAARCYGDSALLDS